MKILENFQKRIELTIYAGFFKKSDFFKSPKKISKNDVSSVRENSKNVASALTASDIELPIILSTIFPEVVGTYLQGEMYILFGMSRIVNSLKNLSCSRSGLHIIVINCSTNYLNCTTTARIAVLAI